MKLLFLRLLVGCIGLLFSLTIFAQTKTDTTYQKRQFDAEQIEKFRQSGDFQYHQEVAKEISWTDRIWQWIIRQLFDLLGTDEGWTTFKILVYIFGGVVFGYFLLKLLGVDVAGLVRTQARKTAPDYLLAEQDIHQINFPQQIQEAINQQDYRNAIRLLYLFALRQLSEKELIKWKINKTNQEYWAELKNNRALQDDFGQVTYFFEWVWYGHFEVEPRTFAEAQSVFKAFDQKLATV